jgi:hypothetical protein
MPIRGLQPTFSVLRGLCAVWGFFNRVRAAPGAPARAAAGTDGSDGHACIIPGTGKGF